ncbi:hypothetical protein PGTUg99_010530 [Puccinia graminis f. sp. tritici]|uniref:Uncharacterized protein n=1 Tax=Puccinia graminis f. sp. tritici TaxID=56615 RepID=A0A5B0NB30_PUCGR|nr:hypothetical protein PGTUg99_010530 [Puccinia graminis f. sp. tritici]
MHSVLLSLKNCSLVDASGNRHHARPVLVREVLFIYLCTLSIRLTGGYWGHPLRDDLSAEEACHPDCDRDQ